MDERSAIRNALQSNPEMARLLRKMVQQGKLKSAADAEEGEPLTVLCKRWPGLVDDCRMALCSFCGEAVALAPSSQELVDQRPEGARFCCMECWAEGKLEEADRVGV